MTSRPFRFRWRTQTFRANLLDSLCDVLHTYGLDFVLHLRHLRDEYTRKEVGDYYAAMCPISHNILLRLEAVVNRWTKRVTRGLIRLRTRQNFEPVQIIGPVQNFGPPARNFGPLRAEFAWREWRKTLGGHVANWAGLSGFSPRENKISHTFFIDFINKYSKVSNAHNSDDCWKNMKLGTNKLKLDLKLLPNICFRRNNIHWEIDQWNRSRFGAKWHVTVPNSVTPVKPIVYKLIYMTQVLCCEMTHKWHVC